MRFRDQLRDWVSDLWADFWGVSPARVAVILAVILYALAEGAIRVGPVFGWISGDTYRAIWIPRLVVGVALLFWLKRACKF